MKSPKCAKTFFPILLVTALLIAIPRPAQTQTYTVIHNFTGAFYTIPGRSLVVDGVGNIYGTTTFDGQTSLTGTIFKLDPAGNLTTLYIFDNGSPAGGLYVDPTGNVFGTQQNNGCGSVFRISTSDDLRTLYNFTCEPDGEFPYTRLVNIKGGLFGTTGGGGSSEQGIVYRVSDNGIETVLHDFTGGADGSQPNDLTRDAAGNLYGTTHVANGEFTGTVYKIDSAGNFSVLYTFTGGVDGGAPYGRLIRDVNGNIHGTTSQGGQLSCVPGRSGEAVGCGVVFRIDGSTGVETVLHKFFDGRGGNSPSSGIVSIGGVLYGTTVSGGDPKCDCGVIYQISRTGRYSVVHRFTGGTDGAGPGDLTVGPDGSIYGTTAYNGQHGCGNGCGTIFKLTP